MKMPVFATQTQTFINIFSVRTVFFSIICLLFSCQAKEKETHAVIETDMGNIEIKLYNNTPKHRDNFIELAKNGKFDGTLFHRVIRDFMIQGGDPTSINAPAGTLLGQGGADRLIPAEIGAPHVRGALAAARMSDGVNPLKQSNSMQFYLVQGQKLTDDNLNMIEMQTKVKFHPALRKRYLEQGGTPQLDGQYTVFGEIVSGLDVLDKIAAVPCDPNSRPLNDVKMKIHLK